MSPKDKTLIWYSQRHIDLKMEIIDFIIDNPSLIMNQEDMTTKDIDDLILHFTDYGICYYLKGDVQRIIKLKLFCASKHEILSKSRYYREFIIFINNLIKKLLF